MSAEPAPGAPPGGPSTVLRVASVPFRDRYVDAVLPDGAVRVGEPGEPSRWLDEAYLTDHAGDVDVLHLHTGYGHLGVRELEHWAETVQRLGVPLVVTVHQLRDATQGVRARHDAHLAAVLGTAEVVLTLTPSAADEIADRYGRTSIVLAHPSLAVHDPELGSERGLVGVRLGAASTAVPDPAAVARAAGSGAVSGGGRLRVLVPAGSEVDEGVRAMAGGGELELVEFGPEELAARLQELHVAVLPERCGTHSRDLEVCRDVGTRVVAPSCGFFADQWSEVVTYANDEIDGLDPVSLTAAVSAALTRPMPRPADRAWREEQRDAVRRVHAEVYAQVAADRSWV
ncbi:glycosyltransferase [Blastococcus sp. TML/M2B]|uniref:glycosyltransferase n=1 Tax=unclassified Blastococcus TaxID=2619396 RepID=UPI00190CD92B|nr:MULTISPECIES: glycosyltransferase [unclassified Blastococcus]MBN1094167.1 glycosyltransferase [Blastococcus sp. TML/M2B]MBN1095715.1 glycosyltransferase [Blastococcus sp. TML/C7B]